MNTGHYITPDDIIFNAAVFAGDKDYKKIPKGVYVSFIRDAFRELNMDSFFMEQRVDLDMPSNLTIALPVDCFDVKNIYMFSGDICNVNNSKKVWWKRNYFTKGGDGYIANDKGINNDDPFYPSRPGGIKEDKSLIRWDDRTDLNNTLYYNIQMGNIMFSSSCRAAGAKVHIHYSGTGGNIIDAPIIPIYFKDAIEDFVVESALRIRVANEPSEIRNLSPLLQMYSGRLDKNGMNGSWHKAAQRVRSMNTSQREELKEYLGRGAWVRGF